jgi:hypothetical protein
MLSMALSVCEIVCKLDVRDGAWAGMTPQTTIEGAGREVLAGEESPQGRYAES